MQQRAGKSSDWVGDPLLHGEPRGPEVLKVVPWVVPRQRENWPNCPGNGPYPYGTIGGDPMTSGLPIACLNLRRALRSKAISDRQAVLSPSSIAHQVLHGNNVGTTDPPQPTRPTRWHEQLLGPMHTSLPANTGALWGVQYGDDPIPNPARYQILLRKRVFVPASITDRVSCHVDGDLHRNLPPTPGPGPKNGLEKVRRARTAACVGGGFRPMQVSDDPSFIL
jgi:hypothetical protein